MLRFDRISTSKKTLKNCNLVLHSYLNASSTDVKKMKQGIVGSGFCFVGMSWCVKNRGPVFSAAFSPIVQIIAAVFDIPFLHEPLHVGR